jgi:DNA-binding NarL/FixJ family response regulator
LASIGDEPKQDRDGGAGAASRHLLVVEDDERVRTLLGTVLCPAGWKPRLAGNAAEALARLRQEPEICLALVDLGLPDVGGIELIRRLSDEYPLLPVVVLTACTAKHEILEAFRAGARGYLFKEDLALLLAPALDEALAGGAPMSRAVARLVLAQVRDQPTVAAAPGAVVTVRERQVIGQLARGLSYRQVGAVLGISSNTVRSYIRTIYEKLAVCSKTEAVLAALRLGILPRAND